MIPSDCERTIVSVGIFNYFYTCKAKSNRAITYDERRSKSVPCFPEVLIYQRCDDVNSRIKDFFSRFFVPFLIRHTHQLLVSLFFLQERYVDTAAASVLSPTTVYCPSMTEEAVKKVQERNRLQQVIYSPVRIKEREEKEGQRILQSQKCLSKKHHCQEETVQFSQF